MSGGETSISFMQEPPVIPYPKKVDIFDSIDIQDIAMGSSHMIVLDKNGTVYVAGSNAEGQLGMDNSVSFL